MCGLDGGAEGDRVGNLYAFCGALENVGGNLSDGVVLGGTAGEFQGGWLKVHPGGLQTHVEELAFDAGANPRAGFAGIEEVVIAAEKGGGA